MTDAQVIDFETTNPDWNGVWDARACLTPFGWTAELFIPWQTLRYHPSNDVWGMNFRRLIRRNNEEILWRARRRTQGILFLPHAGAVAGVSGLPRRAIAEVRPYGAVTGQARGPQDPPHRHDRLLALRSTRPHAGPACHARPPPHPPP